MQETGVDCHSLLQGIFPTQGFSLGCWISCIAGELPSEPPEKPNVRIFMLYSSVIDIQVIFTFSLSQKYFFRLPRNTTDRWQQSISIFSLTRFCHLSPKCIYNLLSYQWNIKFLRIYMPASLWNNFFNNLKLVLSLSIWLIGNSNLVYLLFHDDWGDSVSFIYIFKLLWIALFNCVLYDFFKWGVYESLEKKMATHSSILAWKIPWLEEPGGLLQVQGVKGLDTTEWLHFHFHFMSHYLGHKNFLGYIGKNSISLSIINLLSFGLWKKEMATHSSTLA